MYVYPEPPAEPTCVLLLVPIELVPIVGALFGQMEQRRGWKTTADWEQGYKAFVQLQAQLMSNCLADLIAEIRALRGVKPDYTGVPVEDRTTDMYRDLNDIIGHLNTLIFALSGGLDNDDNIMQILRGDTPATDTRNIVDLLE